MPARLYLKRNKKQAFFLSETQKVKALRGKQMLPPLETFCSRVYDRSKYHTVTRILGCRSLYLPPPKEIKGIWFKFVRPSGEGPLWVKYLRRYFFLGKTSISILRGGCLLFKRWSKLTEFGGNEARRIPAGAISLALMCLSLCVRGEIISTVYTFWEMKRGKTRLKKKDTGKT